MEKLSETSCKCMPMHIQVAKWDFGVGHFRRSERSWPEKLCPLWLPTCLYMTCAQNRALSRGQLPWGSLCLGWWALPDCVQGAGMELPPRNQPRRVFVQKDSWRLFARVLAGPDQNLPRCLSNSLKICTISMLENTAWKHFNIQVLIQSQGLSGCWKSLFFFTNPEKNYSKKFNTYLLYEHDILHILLFHCQLLCVLSTNVYWWPNLSWQFVRNPLCNRWDIRSVLAWCQEKWQGGKNVFQGKSTHHSWIRNC